MAQRLAAWVLSGVTALLDLPWPSRNRPPPCSNEQPGSKTAKPPEPVPISHIRVLPLELHTEILKYLQWKDLLNASLICRTWYQATRSKQLWISLSKYLDSTLGVRRMEEPAKDYSVAELQRWVLKRLQVQESWTTENMPLAFKQRKLQLSNIMCIELLPGGRWLLVNDKEGRFCSYDLDLREPKRRVLIDQDPGVDYNKFSHFPQQFCYWINTSKEKLSLRVSLFQPALHTIGRTRTRIYELNLMGHGEEAFLEATPMVYLPDKKVAQMVARPGAALTGEYFIECMEFTNKSLSITKYFDTENKAFEAIHLEVHVESLRNLHKLYATPNEHIVLIFPHSILIYTIPQLLGHNKEEVLRPLQCIPCDLGFCVSPPWYLEDYMELVYRQQDQFSRMRIFVDESPPKNTPLIKHKDCHRGYTLFTPSTLICLYKDRFVDIITYGSGVDMENSLVSTTKRTSLPDLDTRIPRLPEPTGVEQDIGRIVLAYRNIGRECYILDTV